ncbi:hypothetical protein [Actinoplanes sp. N902-109]|uniref:hypothetical protein n=1 Tax=Actinoplanes sp. (strain N902-109) TaxID=649831 RepID=UPI0012F93F36|nr:hypothetical protein [Actinoplanes sp. N902-109]
MLNIAGTAAVVVCRDGGAMAPAISTALLAIAVLDTVTERSSPAPAGVRNVDPATTATSQR